MFQKFFINVRVWFIEIRIFFDELFIKEQRFQLMLVLLTSLISCLVIFIFLSFFVFSTRILDQYSSKRNIKEVVIIPISIGILFFLTYFSVISELTNYNLRVYGYAIELLLRER